MRFAHRDGTVVHLAYCTNVHPAEDLDAVIAQLRRFGGGIRSRLGVARLGVGLWLPAPLVTRLVDRPELGRLRAELDSLGLDVVTLNAFPYKGFHAPVVKHDVYRPDWTEESRLEYTVNCARVLAQLLPDDVSRGSISTVPVAWRASGDGLERAHQLLDRLASELAAIEDRHGRTIRVGLEPEPGCVVETIDDALGVLGLLDPERIGLCLDACHLAVGFEDPHDTVVRLAGAAVPIVKAQASAALHAADPGDRATREALRDYAENRFLHQVAESGPELLERRDDLPDALAGTGALPGYGPWRVHFHVPVHQQAEPPLATTQDHLRGTLDALVGGGRAQAEHIEVETYTWSVLPEGKRPHDEDELIAGLAGELEWVGRTVRQAGLEAL